MRPYTSRERILIESSHQEGIEHGETSVLLKLLSRKFNKVPNVYQEKIHQADSKHILLWAERLLSCETLEEVFES